MMAFYRESQSRFIRLASLLLTHVVQPNTPLSSYPTTRCSLVKAALMFAQDSLGEFQSILPVSLLPLC